MSFVLNTSQQLSLFDQLAFMSSKKLEILDRSWAKSFSDLIFTKIDEHIFAPLYSERSNSRPNAPVNVLVSALILKDLNNLSDRELVESCYFDFRYQYALHTTSFEDQPVSERTLSRFRSRLAAYELTTGTDLVHECFVALSEGIRQYMEIGNSIKRMDSMMVESNIRRMGRLELLYTCLSNLIKELHRDGKPELITGLEHYADPNDRNSVVYHQNDTPVADRLQTVIDDATSLLPKCREDYADSEDYQLLERAIKEQTKKDDNDHCIPKEKGEGIKASSLQNPADPDATYRTKAGKEHRGYAANITEAVDENGSIVTDYQYEKNTTSDTSFLREEIDKTPKQEETMALIADGAYAGKELTGLAAEKNIGVLTTGLRGRIPNEILKEFQLSEDGTSVTACPEGNVPKSVSYDPKRNKIRVSFLRSCCENCPHCKECRAKLRKRTAFVMLSLDARDHAIALDERRDDPTYKLIGRIRNGIETVPSLLRRKYHVDHMPVRGLAKTRIRFGFKMLALNFTKLWFHELGMQRSRAFE